MTRSFVVGETCTCEDQCLLNGPNVKVASGININISYV